MTTTLKTNTNKHVVAFGDFGFATAGQPLFTFASGTLNYNVLPGQLVAWTQDDSGTTITHDAGSLTSSDIEELYVGVGYDSTGNGVVDSIRHIGIDHISGCNPREASASSPRCGGPQVIDFYFDCTEFEATYSLMVKVDDNLSRSFGAWNKTAVEFVGTVNTHFEGCTDCPPEHNCKEIACKMASQLNGELDLKVANRAYPDWKGKGLPRPYYATRLHNVSNIYCLTPDSPTTDCEGCLQISALTGVKVNGTTITFVGTTKPGDSTKSMIGQLDSIVNQINQAFQDEYGEKAHVGSAYFTGSYSNCCPIQLHVNTCDTGFELLGVASAQVVPDINSDPFVDHGTRITEPDCIDCGDTPTTVTYPCGIRIIAEQVKGDCDCFLEKPLNFYGRKIEVNPIGEGFRGKPWRVVEVQQMELPANFGAYIQWLEYQSDIGGRGRIYARSNDDKGWLNLPGKRSRAVNAVVARCDKDYCSYYYNFFLEKKYLNNQFGFLSVHSHVHIPYDDSVTITAWELFSDALLGFNPLCKTIGLIECDTDFGACPPVATPSPSPTSTPGVTDTPTPTPTVSNTPTPSATISGTPGLTPTTTPTPTASVSLTASISLTPTPTITATVSSTPTITPSTTSSPTPSISLTPSISITPTVTSTPSPSS